MDYCKDEKDKVKHRSKNGEEEGRELDWCGTNPKEMLTSYLHTSCGGAWSSLHMLRWHHNITDREKVIRLIIQADETEISQVPSRKGQRSRKIRTPLILVQVVEIRRRGSRWQPLERTADVGRWSADANGWGGGALMPSGLSGAASNTMVSMWRMWWGTNYWYQGAKLVILVQNMSGNQDYAP